MRKILAMLCAAAVLSCLCATDLRAEEKKFIEKARLIIENTRARSENPDTTIEADIQDRVVVIKMFAPNDAVFTKTYEITAHELGSVVREEPEGLKKLFSGLGKKVPKREEVIRAYMVYAGYISFISVGESFLVYVVNGREGAKELCANVCEYRLYEIDPRAKGKKEKK